MTLASKEQTNGTIKKRKFHLSFSRKQLCIPYALFLIMFVVFPLLLVVYYAFTDSAGAITLNNFIEFFTDTTKISTL